MSYCSPLLLNCFNGKKFTLFILGTVFIPYLLFTVVAKGCNFKRKRDKTLTQHYETIVGAICSMSILWFLGNYEETYDTTTFVSTIAGLFIFSFIVETFKRTHSHTLATMHKWNGDMRMLVNISLIVIAAFAVHHYHLAASYGKMYGSDFSTIYLFASGIPLILAYLGYKAAEWENGTNGNGSDEKFLFHLHHVHLFYAMAFFTRFPELWSKIAAGLVIGASMHGAAAFGYDRSFQQLLTNV